MARVLVSVLAAAIVTVSVCQGVDAAPMRVLAGRIVAVRVGAATFDVTKYGAKGDAKNDDTPSVQKAFDAAASAGGGTVLFPAPGKYLVCSFHFSGSHTHMQVDAGATVLVNNDRKADCWKSKEDVITTKSEDYTDLAMTGQGVVEGQGAVWWANRDDFRPRLVNIHGSNVLVQDLTFQNSPNHNLEMETDHTEMSNVTILAPPSTHVSNPSHNTDAVDVHGDPFYIHDCHFSVGDDNIAAHANNTLVEDCTFGTGHGASIGSVGDGTWLQNITFRRITFQGTTTGCRIKTDAGAHGIVQDVTYEDLTMTNVGTTIDITMFYSDAGSTPRLRGAKSSAPPMQVSHITFKNITADKGGAPGGFTCGDGGCHDIVLDDVTNTDTPGDWTCKDASGSTSGTVTPASCL